MTEIYFVRHSKFDRRLTNCNNKDLPLTKDGLVFAKRKLNIPELKDIDVLFASEYLRSKSTAEVISEYNNNIQIKVINLINEREKGDTTNVPDSFWDTQIDDENAKTLNGESRKEVTDRMVLFVNSLLNNYKNKKIVAVSHGVAIAYLLMNYCELSKHNYINKHLCLSYQGKIIEDGKIGYCDIYKFTFGENKELLNIEKLKK